MRQNYTKNKDVLKRGLSLVLAASITLTNVSSSALTVMASDVTASDIIVEALDDTDIVVEAEAVNEASADASSDENTDVVVESVEVENQDVGDSLIEEVVETPVEKPANDMVETPVEVTTEAPVTENADIPAEEELVAETDGTEYVTESEAETDLAMEIEEIEIESESETEIVLESYEFDLALGSVYISDYDEDSLSVVYGDVQYDDVTPGEFTFTGSSSENTISIDTTMDLDLVFDQVNLVGDIAPISLKGDANYTVTLNGKNVLKIGEKAEGGAAFIVGEKASLKIKNGDKGMLYADATGGYENTYTLIRPREVKETVVAVDTSGESENSGESGSDERNQGDGESDSEDDISTAEIVEQETEIETEIVYLETEKETVYGAYGAGIGSAVGEKSGEIYIEGGLVYAVGGSQSNDIGSGRDGEQGKVVISGGNVPSRTSDAEDEDGNKVYPVLISGLTQTEDETDVEVSVNGNAYNTYSAMIDESGEFVFYAPIGKITAVVAGDTYTGVNTEYGVELGVYVAETEQEAEISLEEADQVIELEAEATDVSYENFNVELSDSILYLDKENGRLAFGDVYINLKADSVGTTETDRVEFTGTISLPEGVIIPDNMVVSDDKITSNDDTIFEVTKVSGENEDDNVENTVKFIGVTVEDHNILFTFEAENFQSVGITFKASSFNLELEGNEDSTTYYVLNGLLEDADIDAAPDPSNGLYFTKDEVEEASKYYSLLEIHNVYKLKGLSDFVFIDFSAKVNGMNEDIAAEAGMEVIDSNLYNDTSVYVDDTSHTDWPGDYLGFVDAENGIPTEYIYGGLSLDDQVEVLGYGNKINAVTNSNGEISYRTTVTAIDAGAYMDFADGACMYNVGWDNNTYYDVRLYFWIAEDTQGVDYLSCHYNEEYGGYVLSFPNTSSDDMSYETTMGAADTKYAVMGVQVRFYKSGHVGQDSYEVPFKGVCQILDIDGADAATPSKEAGQHFLEAVRFVKGVESTSEVYAIKNAYLKHLTATNNTTSISAPWASTGDWYYGTKGNNGAPITFYNSLWGLINSNSSNRLGYRVRTCYVFGNSLKSYVVPYTYNIVNLDDMVSAGYITTAQKETIDTYLVNNSGVAAPYGLWKPQLAASTLNTYLSQYNLKFSGWYSNSECTTDVPSTGLLLDMGTDANISSWEGESSIGNSSASGTDKITDLQNNAAAIAYGVVKPISKAVVSIKDVETEVELDGAIYRVLDSEGNVMGEWTSVHNDNTVINGLKVGVQYTLEIVSPRKGYSNDVVLKDGYTSPYVEDGFIDNTGRLYEARDVNLGIVTKNTAKFVLEDTDLLQVINVFAQPVKSDLKIIKKGEVPRVSVKSGKVRGIFYSIKGLPNAEYEVYANGDIVSPDGYSKNIYNDGEYVTSVVTDNNGYAYITDLYLGEYSVVETHAPAGYSRDEEDCSQMSDILGYYEEQYFSAGVYAEEKITIENEFANTRQRIDIGTDIAPSDDPVDDYKDPDKDLYMTTGIYKIGVDGRKEYPVEGAEFTLYAREDIYDVYGNLIIPADTEVATAVSDSDGRAAFNVDVPLGKYYVLETGSPAGYHSADTVIEWEADEWREDEEVEIARYTGVIKNKITVTKVILRDSIRKNELAGGEIQIVDDYGNVADVIITENTEGTGVVVKGLTPGTTYHLVETVPPYGYTNAVIIPEEMEGILARETRNDVSFTISDDAEESLLIIENAFVTGTFFIDKNGEDLRCVRITDEDRYFLGNKIEWRKTEFGYKKIKLEGAVFAVYAREDIFHPDGTTGILYHKDELVKMNVTTTRDDAIVTTDNNGCAGFWSLYLGQYYVKEIEMPNGYVRNTVVTDVDLECKDYVTQNVILEEDIVYDNVRQKIDMSITKRDTENEVITVAGAVFGLYAKEDITDTQGNVIVEKDTLIETVVTGEDGVAHFEADLPLAMYYVKELQAPEGYTSSEEIIVVDASTSVDCRNTVEYKLAFKNEQTKVMVSFMDYNTEVELDGVIYEIVDADGNVVAELTSENGNNTIVRGLRVGEVYTVVEKVPRDGYGNTIYVKDDFASEHAINGITKKGVTYEAFDLATMSVKVNKTDFMVQDKGGVQVINLFNKSTMSDITIHKEGEAPVTSVKDGKLYLVRYEVKGLPGAEFNVYADGDISHIDGYTGIIYKDGELIDTLVTDENGDATLYDMPLGRYKVVETKAPYGYARDYEASEKVFDVAAYYEDSYFATGEYADELVQFTETFTNIRQTLDIGSDIVPDIDGIDEIDPDKELYLKAGIVKLSREGDETEGVQGAVFELYAAEDIVDIYGNVVIDKDTFIERATSDENGRVRFATFDLPAGKYKAVEVEAPAGHYPSDKEYIFDTSVRNSDDEVQILRQSIEVENYKTVTKLYLYDDLTGVELDGATLRILDADGNVVTTIVTANTNGIGHTINGLNPGDTYTIEEVIPRYGYTNRINISEDMAETLTRVASNKVSFTVPSEMIEKTVIRISNSYVTGSFIVAKEGSGLFDVRTVTEERSFSYRVYQWLKTNFRYGGVPAAGVEFTAYASEDIYHPDGQTGLIYSKGDKVRMNVRTINNMAIVVTDASGLADFEYLYLGDYYVRETSLNAGYLRNDSIENISLEYKDYETSYVTADENVEFVNERQQAQITVITRDKEDESLKPEGAIYGLYTAERIYSATGSLLIEKDTLIETVCTDEKGFAVFESNIPFANYYVKEIEPAIGYDSNPEIKEVAFLGDKSGEAILEYNLIFDTERTKTAFALMDYDTEVELIGVNFSIYDGDGNLVTHFSTERNNNIIVRGLEHNTIYTLVEELPAFGYSRTLYMKEGYFTPYKTIGYDDREYATFDATDMGITSLRENVAQFKIADSNNVQVISLFNKAVMGGISIKTTGDVPKVVDGNIIYYTDGLPGMKYTIKAKDKILSLDGMNTVIYEAGEVIAEVITDANGDAALPNLYLGTYIVEETEAVNGYVRNDVTQTIVDVKDFYKENYYAQAEYKGVPFLAGIELSNKIQKTDLGLDLDTLNTTKDPENYLCGKTSITVRGSKGGRMELVSGATFSLYAKKRVLDVYGNVLYNEGDLVATATSNANGRVRFLQDIPVGTYVAKETAKAFGYEHIEDEILFDLSIHADDDLVEITRASADVTTETSKTSIMLIDDGTKKELEGTVLQIVDEDGQVVETISTYDTEGNGYTVYGLNQGDTYYLVETSARDGYTKNIVIPSSMGDKLTRVSDYKVSFTVPETDDMEIVIANQFVTGSILVEKTGEVLDSLNQTYWNCEYLLKEFQWMISDFGYVDKGMMNTEYTVYAAENIYHPDGVTGLIYKKGDVVKTNVRKGALEAVELTGVDGLAYFGEMYLGKYVVKETNTPTCLVKDETQFNATLSYKDDTTPVVRADEGRIFYTESRQKVSVSVVRRDSNNLLVEGSIVGLYTKDDIVTENGDVLVRKGTLIETQQTDASGTAQFTADLPHGWYYVKELIPAYGCDAYTGSIDVDLSAKESDDTFLLHQTVVIK